MSNSEFPVVSPSLLVPSPTLSLPTATHHHTTEDTSGVSCLLSSFPRLTLEPPVPSDDIPDVSLPGLVVTRRAEEHCPVESLVASPSGGTLRERFTQEAQRRFRIRLGECDPRICARLDQPFGEDNLMQFFCF